MSWFREVIHLLSIKKNLVVVNHLLLSLIHVVTFILSKKECHRQSPDVKAMEICDT